MKLAVAAEGEHELGGLPDLQKHDSVARVWIERLLGGIGQSDVNLLPIKLSGGDFGAGRMRHGEREQAAYAYEVAAAKGCDGLILFRDTDADVDRKRPLIEQGLLEASVTGRRSMAAVLALQIRMLEAWLLADAGAFERAFRRRRSDLPKGPEEIWGKRSDPQSNHPKRVYARVLRELGIANTQGTALALAEAADLDVVARACPEGFGRFRADFERAFRPFDCVVAADLDGGIGKDNDLPWPKLKTDVKHFRDLTTAAPTGKRNAVIMGRKTWDSCPAKYRPLPGRWNLVVSRGTVELAGDAVQARSLDDALTRASLAADVDRIFVIGGGEIYRQAFAHVRCGDVYLTRLDFRFDCDAHIPDVREHFERIETEPTVQEAGFAYAIERWRRRGRVAR